MKAPTKNGWVESSLGFAYKTVARSHVACADGAHQCIGLTKTGGRPLPVVDEGEGEGVVHAAPAPHLPLKAPAPQVPIPSSFSAREKKLCGSPATVDKRG